jgi:uncharacterized protein (DUF2062 family)
MKFNYNKLVQKVDAYLRKKRAGSRIWAIMLPESLFRPELWLWEKHSVARGAAWGTSWALAPVPMQTIFAVLSSIRTRGNIPMSVLSCCISFPGYQLVAWPLQWYAGAVVLGWLGLSSGVDMELIRSCASAAATTMHRHCTSYRRFQTDTANSTAGQYRASSGRGRNCCALLL